MKILENKKIIGLLVIIIFGLYSYNVYINKKIIDRNEELELLNNKLNNNLIIYKDENNLYRVKAESAESNLNIIKKVYENELKELRKEFNEINKKYSNLSNIYNVSLETINNLELIVESYDKFVDTTFNYDGSIDNIIYTRNFNYNDEWSNISGSFIFNTNMSFLDKVNIKYSIKDSITFVSYYVRDNIFSNKKLYVQGKSYNPNTIITNIKEIKINNYKEPKWSIGFQSGYGLTRYGLGWYIGLGINRKVIQW